MAPKQPENLQEWAPCPFHFPGQNSCVPLIDPFASDKGVNTSAQHLLCESQVGSPRPSLSSRRGWARNRPGPRPTERLPAGPALPRRYLHTDLETPARSLLAPGLPCPPPSLSVSTWVCLGDISYLVGWGPRGCCPGEAGQIWGACWGDIPHPGLPEAAPGQERTTGSGEGLPWRWEHQREVDSPASPLQDSLCVL